MEFSSNSRLEKHYISLGQKDQILSFLRSAYNLDLSEYSEASVRRRLTKMLNEFNLDTAKDLETFLNHQTDGQKLFLEKFTVNVTEMFRDPHFFKAVLEKVIAPLKDQEEIRIWSAGCSSGEEILSFTILLHELGILPRCRILGTDLNQQMLDIARSLTYKIRHIRTYFKPYLYAGGAHGLEQYFTTHGDNAIFHPYLHEHVVFRRHNLSDPLPDEKPFDLIICRNVLIYFKAILQSKVISNLDEHLKPKGFLGLGSKESIIFYEGKDRFKDIDIESKIYQKH